LSRYAASRKVAGFNPDEDIECFQFTQSFQPYYCPGVYKLVPEELSWGKVDPACKADNITDIYEPIV
jgi:hypothetical protein